MEVYIAHTVYHEANAFHIIRMLRHYEKKRKTEGGQTSGLKACIRIVKKQRNSLDEQQQHCVSSHGRTNNNIKFDWEEKKSQILPHLQKGNCNLPQVIHLFLVVHL